MRAWLEKSAANRRLGPGWKADLISSDINHILCTFAFAHVKPDLSRHSGDQALSCVSPSSRQNQSSEGYMPLVSHELWSTYVEISQFCRPYTNLRHQLANNHRLNPISNCLRHIHQHRRAIHSTQVLYNGIAKSTQREVLETFKKTRTSHSRRDSHLKQC